ncbi:class I SAM-dependent methyltransferase [Paenibacillus sp. GP183]|uniref:tRNA (adenine(22)-N(1))-methyltransferase n=1 Tax=Paenibacillus sp. GP183 TaxID=1882751 RepID=UPI000896317A|nr:class I SAM-dependent methyltransferase [Paenibacillus sp. GP183]SEB41236.1 tRNA (adenine22-N1)-methyltransferase [Paenibacillus sp. GP183]
MTVKLSKRLQRIADKVPSFSRLADIGSDHALLPAYLVQAGIVTWAIAGEVNPGPLAAAAKQVKESGLTGKIEVREGNGLEVLCSGEVDVISIAGMGGSLIASILEGGQDKLSSVNMLVLQPNVGEDQVRRWLDRHQWLLESEDILEEDGKIYEILTAVPAGSHAKNRSEMLEALYQVRKLGPDKEIGKERQLQMGPYLLQEAGEVWHRKWQGELDKLEMIREQLSLSDADASKLKAETLRKEIQDIREVLALCLQKDKP